jgi:hypothetical protein
MSGFDKHGAAHPGRVGAAKHRGDPLSVEQIKSLKPGTRIVVTWSGGNGPHEGVVVEDEHFGLCYSRAADDPIRHALLALPSQTIPLNRVTLSEPQGEEKS